MSVWLFPRVQELICSNTCLVYNIPLMNSQLCMMGNRCATIVQLTPSPLIQRYPELPIMLSHLIHKAGSWETCRNRNETKEGNKRSWKTEAKPRRHDTRGLCECNLSASEGHCRHIYSPCHKETYFSSASGITAYQRLSPGTESFPQHCNKIVSQCAARACPRFGSFSMFSPITDVHSVKNSELDALELARFLSDETVLKVCHSNGFYEGSIIQSLFLHLTNAEIKLQLWDIIIIMSH